MDARYYHGTVNDTQPGLEVVPQERLHDAQTLPQARHYDSKELAVSKYPENTNGSTPGSQYPPSSSQAPLEAVYPDGPGKSSSKRKRFRLIIAAVVVAIVILVAVLGGVLGSRVARSSAASTSSPSASPNTPENGNTTTTRPKSIRPGSALGISGFRKLDGGIEMYLFYQEPGTGDKVTLRYSRCDTFGKTASNGSSSCWGTSNVFDSNAVGGTRLANTMLVYGTRFQPQVQMYYIGPSNRLLGSNFNDQSIPFVAQDSISDQQIVTGANSSVGGYWPWAMYQDANGGLFHVRDRLLAGFSPTSDWDVNNINVTAMAGTDLVMVPMSTNFSRIAAKGGYAVFYQGTDSKLAVTITDLNSPELDKSYPLSWPTSLPSVTLQKQAPIAAFSVARTSDPQQRVNTYVLYLDSTDIKMLYTDLSSGSPVWTTAQPAGLRGVDPETKISCLSMSASPLNGGNAEVLVEPASDETTRCYFQKGGVVTEAKLAGTDWVIVGNVPIP